MTDHRTPNQTPEFTHANRQAWDEAAPYHETASFAELLQAFTHPGHSCLDPIETGVLLDLGIGEKSVAQLCCNNGRELLSVKNLGAGRCVGFDSSAPFLEQARSLAAAGGIACDFVQTDVYEIPQDYAGAFDLVYITAGVIGWMPNLPGFFCRVSKLLKAGGRVFIYEMHPITGMFNFDGQDQGDPPTLVHSYFRTRPDVYNDGLDYFSDRPYQSVPMYWFHYTLGEILTACLESGLTLQGFAEYRHDLGNVFGHFERNRVLLPLSFSLVARN